VPKVESSTPGWAKDRTGTAIAANNENAKTATFLQNNARPFGRAASGDIVGIKVGVRLDWVFRGEHPRLSSMRSSPPNPLIRSRDFSDSTKNPRRGPSFAVIFL
jgi:hypothetical protein